MELYALALYVEEKLYPLVNIQKMLETKKSISLEMHHILNKTLKDIFDDTWEPIQGGRCQTVMNMIDKQEILNNTMKTFMEELHNKWVKTIERNLNPKTSNLWKHVSIFDPFQKNHNLLDVKAFCGDMTQYNLQEDSVHDYMKQILPNKEGFDLFDYWKEQAISFPELSNFILDILSMPSGSCDVERSFSNLRQIQTPQRTSLSEENLKMQLMIYLNNKIQNE